MRRQGYGSSDAIDQMHHGNRSFPLQISPNPRENPRLGPLTRPNRRPSPSQDSESEKGGNQARKRINVAVKFTPTFTESYDCADILSSALDAARERSSAVGILELAYVLTARTLAQIVASS